MHVDANFRRLSRAALADDKLGEALHEVEFVMPVIRADALEQLDFVAARERAAQVKDEALNNLAANLGVLLGSLAGPLLATYTGLRTALLVAAGLRLLAGLAALTWASRWKRRTICCGSCSAWT